MPIRDSRVRARRERWFAGVVLLLSVSVCAVVVALPAALRLLPPRYLQRLPEPLQALAAQPHNSDFVPTPAGSPAPLRLTWTPAATWPAATAVPARATETATDRATETAQPRASDTTAPSAAPSETPTLEPRPSPTRGPRNYAYCPSQVGRGTPADTSQATTLLDGFTYTCQTWNNCGPATLTMGLSYFGWAGDQARAASFLKPDPEDKNVSPWQMAEYARSQGYGAEVRTGGTLDTIKRLLDAGLPVLIEKGFDPEPEKLGWMGHYELIVGYSDALQQLVAMDSYLGPDQAVTYADLARFWMHFNYAYVALYKPDQQERIDALLGPADAAMYQAALAMAQAAVDADPGDGFAWFNLGTNLVALGDLQNAAAAYDRARQAGLPWRMLWYQFGPYDAYLGTGRYDDVIALADSVINYNTGQYVEESFYYKGLALKAKGDLAGARTQFEYALQHNYNFSPASAALAALP